MKINVYVTTSQMRTHPQCCTACHSFKKIKIEEASYTALHTYMSSNITLLDFG